MSSDFSKAFGKDSDVNIAKPSSQAGNLKKFFQLRNHGDVLKLQSNVDSLELS